MYPFTSSNSHHASRRRRPSHTATALAVFRPLAVFTVLGVFCAFSVLGAQPAAAERSLRIESLDGITAEEFGFAGEEFTADERDRWSPVPLGPSKALTSGPLARGGFINHCLIDFDDDVIISTLPNQAADSFVTWPFWTEQCGSNGIGIGVEPIGYWHYHLNFVDPPVWCGDIGAMGHVDEEGVCHPIDPVTEPRSGIQPHLENFGIRIYAYDIASQERVHFDLNQIRILGGDSEVCFQRTDYPWMTTEPAQGPAGYCGMVEPGNWDVSDTVTDAYEVRVWSRSPLMSMTDLGIGF